MIHLVRIDPPAWTTQPSCRVGGVSVGTFARLQASRDTMLRVVHSEVTAYLNDERLVFTGSDDGFPHIGRLTGAYYVGGEGYAGHQSPEWVQISIQCSFLERPKPGMNRIDDYLGLEVWLRWTPETPDRYAVYRNTDSSVI